MIKSVYRSSCKVLVIVVRFEQNLGFRDVFEKNTEIPNFMKLRPVAAEFCADGRTDRCE
jgi:hypothetical protein